jgi:hypothetical protein
MQTKFGRRAGVLMAATAALAATAAPATAAPPSACAGVALTDATGDASFVDPAAPPEFFSPAPANMDVQQVFFTRQGGKLRANIQVENLDKTTPETAEPSTPMWAVDFVVGDNFYAAKVALRDGEFVYSIKTYEPATGAGLPDVATTGEAFEGPKGVLAIDLPADVVTGVETGAEFTDIAVDVWPDSNPAVRMRADWAPEGDDPTGSWTAADCAAAKPVVAPPATSPAAAPPPPSAPAPSPAAPQAEAPAAPAATPAAALAAAPRAVTKKAKSKKCATKAKKGKKARRAATCKAKAKKKAKARAKKRR